jgi:hypothetical protein
MAKWVESVLRGLGLVSNHLADKQKYSCGRIMD